MTEVRFLPPAAKFIKKLKDKKLKMLYQEAVDKIRSDYTIGEAKTGIFLVYTDTIFIIIRQIMSLRIQWSIWKMRSLLLSWLVQGKTFMIS